MKKILLLFLLLVLSSEYSYSQKNFASDNIYDQNVNVIDRIEEDGKRQLMVEAKPFSFGRNKYRIGIKAFLSENITDWLLMVSSYHQISKESVLLIKLGNEKIIELPVNNVVVGDLTDPGYSIITGHIITHYPSTKTDYYYSIYSLSEDVISKITSCGIKKMRVYDGLKFHDRNHCGTLNQYIIEGIKAIKEHTQGSLQRQDLHEDF